MNNDLVILIPCFNCGAAVIPVIEECRRYASRVVAVNDGSTDETPDILQKSGVEIIGWEKNRGKGAALQEGFRHLLQQDGWQLVITLDSDGQHDPADIPNFLALYQAIQADLSLGTRSFERAKTPASRYWANVISSKTISTLTRCSISDFQCGYRMFTRQAIERMLSLLTSDAYSIETEMALLAKRLGLTVAEVGIRTIYDDASSSRSAWRPLLDSYRIVKVVVKHLLKPTPKK